MAEAARNTTEAERANETGPGGVTRLHEAVLRSDAPAVRGLLLAGADPNVRDAGVYGYTPAILAVRLGVPSVIGEFAMDWRTDWDKRDGVGLSAKHYAGALRIRLARVCRSGWQQVDSPDGRWPFGPDRPEGVCDPYSR